MSTSIKYNETIRRLIVTASKGKLLPDSTEYNSFLEAVSEAVPCLMDSHRGIFVVQSIFYHPISSVLPTIAKIRSVNWIFEYVTDSTQKSYYRYANSSDR